METETRVILSKSELDQLLDEAAEKAVRKYMEQAPAIKGHNNQLIRGRKEIANYLGVSETTVAKYKVAGMPTHRAPGAKLIFAYSSEIDDWLNSYQE